MYHPFVSRDLFDLKHEPLKQPGLFDVEKENLKGLDTIADGACAKRNMRFLAEMGLDQLSNYIE